MTKLWTVGALVLAGATTVQAVPVTVSGSNFSLSYDNAALGLFGSPTLVGNTLVFTPASFTANTSSDIALIASTFVATVTANAGYTVTSLSLAEGGDYAFFGANNLVAAGGELRATTLVGSPTTLVDNIDMTSGPVVAQATVLPFPTKKWTADASLSFNAASAAVQIQNLLFALASDTTANDYAFIQKKNVALTIGVSPVPEPETYAMMLAGVAAVLFLAGRRRKN